MAGAPFCFPFFGLIPSQQNDTIMLNTNSVNGSVRPSLGRWEMEAWLFLQWKRALNPAFTSEKPILEGNRVYGSVYVVQYCRPSLGPVNCKTLKQSFCQSITFASHMHVSCLKKIKKKKKKRKVALRQWIPVFELCNKQVSHFQKVLLTNNTKKACVAMLLSRYPCLRVI